VVRNGWAYVYAERHWYFNLKDTAVGVDGVLCASFIDVVRKRF